MNKNKIADLTITAIKSSEAYDKAIEGLRAALEGKTDTQVRSVLLPIVGDYYGVTVAKVATGPTAGQLGFSLGEKPSEDAKRRRSAASMKLSRLVSAICNEDCTSEAAKAAAKMASLMKRLGALTPKQKRSIVNTLAGELGLTVK